MSVDPVASLLVAYGRTTLAKTELSGRAAARGRKPWLALRFPRGSNLPDGKPGADALTIPTTATSPGTVRTLTKGVA